MMRGIEDASPLIDNLQAMEIAAITRLENLR